MTDSVLVFPPGWRALDANGNVYPGARIEFYAAGTSNPLEVFSDKNLSVSLGTSIDCDAGGYPTSDGNNKTLIYTGTAPYKVVLQDSDGTTVWTHDNIRGAVDTSDFLTNGDLTPAWDVEGKTADFSVGANDRAKLFDVNPTGGSIAVTVGSPITLGSGFIFGIRYAGTANTITISASAGAFSRPQSATERAAALGAPRLFRV